MVSRVFEIILYHLISDSMYVDILPWAGDYPVLRIEINDMKVFMTAPKRTFWVYFNVQTIPSKKYEDLKEVAPSAKWSFLIDTGVEQLHCTNTVSWDVRKVLDHAVLSYRHRETNTLQWEIPISTKDAQQLSAHLKKAFAEMSPKYLVKEEGHHTFQPFKSVLKYSGDLSKYRFR